MTTKPILPPPPPPDEPDAPRRYESSDTVPIDGTALEKQLALIRATAPEPGATLTAEELQALIAEGLPDEPPTSPATPDAMRSSSMPPPDATVIVETRHVRKQKAP